MSTAVTDYLGELGTALRVGARRQRRISAEVSDHLAELIADETARGADDVLAAERAVQRFGAPAELAAEFNADAVRYALSRAACGLAACAAAAFFAAGLSLQTGAARPWPSGLVFSLVMQLWVQVPVACGAIALFLAAVAPWLRGTLLAGRPAALAGRSLALASVLLLPVVVVAAANLGTGMPAAERLLLAIVVAATPVAAIIGLRAAARASWLGRSAGEDVLDVIAAVGGALAGRWSLAARAHQLAGDSWRMARERTPWLTRWLDLRHHPWRAAATVSVAAGLLLKAPDLLIGDPDFLGSAMEAAAVYTCFAALGGVLGLRAVRPLEMRSRVKIATTA
ncbi:MAG TPA: permease prefix domain 1-containing protein [Streptosporangiaceae bacterium]|nr:permease prefix domain 1-containing protein [Streptosporangiaceae bacterium]